MHLAIDLYVLSLSTSTRHKCICCLVYLLLFVLYIYLFVNNILITQTFSGVCSGHIVTVNVLPSKWKNVSIRKFGNSAIHTWITFHTWSNFFFIKYIVVITYSQSPKCSIYASSRPRLLLSLYLALFSNRRIIPGYEKTWQQHYWRNGAARQWISCR